MSPFHPVLQIFFCMFKLRKTSFLACQNRIFWTVWLCAWITPIYKNRIVKTNSQLYRDISEVKIWLITYKKILWFQLYIWGQKSVTDVMQFRQQFGLNKHNFFLYYWWEYTLKKLFYRCIWPYPSNKLKQGKHWVITVLIIQF
jgi:hypothetical protein